MLMLMLMLAHSDGGLRDGQGAAAFVIFGVNAAKPLELVLLESDVVYMPEQTSAFLMETIAIAEQQNSAFSNAMMI